MDITDIENLKFIIPIMGVIGLGSFIFLFGFKHSVTPPSFEDLIDLDNKKGKKKKTKYDKLKISNPKPKEGVAKKIVPQAKSKKEESVTAQHSADVKDVKKIQNDKREKQNKGKNEDVKGKKHVDMEKPSPASDGWMTIPPRKDKKVVAPLSKQGGKQHFGGDEGRSSTSPEFMSHSESSDFQETQKGKGSNKSQETLAASNKKANNKGKDKAKGKETTLAHGLGNIVEKPMAYEDDHDVEMGTHYDNYDGYNEDQPQYSATAHHNTMMQNPIDGGGKRGVDNKTLNNNMPAKTSAPIKGGSQHLPSFSSSGGSSVTSSHDTISNEWELLNHPTPDVAPAPLPLVKPILKLTTEEEWAGQDNSPQERRQLPCFGASLSNALTGLAAALDHNADAWLNDYSSYFADGLATTTSTSHKDKSPIERALLEEIKRKRDLCRDRVPEAFTFDDDNEAHTPPTINRSAGEGGAKPYYQPNAGASNDNAGILPEAYGGPKKTKKKVAKPPLASSEVTQNGHYEPPMANGPSSPGDPNPSATVKKAKKKKKAAATSANNAPDGVGAAA